MPGMSRPMPDWLIGRLACPACRSGLIFEMGSDGDGILRHGVDTGCVEGYPVIDGIPRMLLAPHRRSLWRAHREWFAVDDQRRALGDRWTIGAEERGRSARVVRAFDDEWRRFDVVDGDDERIGF